MRQLLTKIYRISFFGQLLSEPVQQSEASVELEAIKILDLITK